MFAFLLNLDATYNLCLKDLSDEMVREVTLRLEGDPTSEERFRKSFGLYSKRKLQPELVVSDIKKLFPDTPVRLLKDVFEALQLYDIVELLEKAKPRTLRPALPLKEIERLPEAINRPTTFYSKTSVLIIDNGTDDSAEIIESSFKTLNSGGEVITISVAQLVTKREALRRVKNTKEGILRTLAGPYYYRELSVKEELELVRWGSRKNQQEILALPAQDRQRLEHLQRKFIADESTLEKDLEKILKEKEKRMKSKNLDSVKKELRQKEEEIRQKEEELQQKDEEFQMALSAVVNKWVEQEGWLK